MKYSMCPNAECQAQWGIEEIYYQECDYCGWPNVDKDDYEWPDNDYDYESE
jgi:hypothetical protein